MTPILFLLPQDEKYIKYVESLTHMLQRYNRLLASLDNAEVSSISQKHVSHEPHMNGCFTLSVL